MSEPDFCPCARCQAEKAKCVANCSNLVTHHAKTAPHLQDSLLSQEQKDVLAAEYAKYVAAYQLIIDAMK